MHRDYPFVTPKTPCFTRRSSRMIEASGGARYLRVKAGESMVTPVAETIVTYGDGSRETLIPGRSRFAPEHEVVRQRPELFELCCRDDRTNAPAVFREALRAADRRLTRQLAEIRGERLPARPSTSTGDEKDIPGRSKMSKKELVEALSE